MRRLSLIAAVGLAASTLPAAAAPAVGDPGTSPIFRCVIEYLRVDGLPLVRHEWCTRVGGAGSRIVPLTTEEGGSLVFGIRPYRRPADKPIPKHQRRLE